MTSCPGPWYVTCAQGGEGGVGRRWSMSAGGLGAARAREGQSHPEASHARPCSAKRQTIS
eukprot:scaffold32736_cov124-Isochrysis_galbana.AAC.2